MSGRSYDIAPGSVDRSGRISPPKPPHHAPPQLDYQSSPYSERDVSPIRNQPTRDYGFAAPAVSNAIPQDSGSQALGEIDHLYNPRMMSPSPEPYEVSSTNLAGLGAPNAPSAYQQTHSQSSLAPLATNQGPYSSSPPRSPERTAQRGVPPMAAGAGVGAGAGALGYGVADFDGRMPRGSYYHGDGYDDFDPSSIADDGDDEIENNPTRSRNSVLGNGAAGAGAGAAGAGMLKAFGSRDASGSYGPVGADPEKSAWLSKQSSGNKRMKWIIGIIIAILVVGAIVGGVVGGILSRHSGGSSGSSGGGSSGSSGSHSGGLYDINSDEVQAVLNNDNLHKVFPAMDYTPNYAQYPQCLAKGGGPIQNNVTIDVAIMSQLTPAIRLYGTDCNQTELVLEAIKQLNMQDTMKVWLGVYLNSNTTTNDRQLHQLYSLLDDYPHDSFAGVIVGNEVLYGKYLTATQLQQELEFVRSNFSAKGIQLPVSTADLGDNWTADLAQASDIVMANIHPFFAGTVADGAAGWAWDFWTQKDKPLTTSTTGTAGSITYPKQIISEIGWPSQGGNDCGDANSDTYGCTSSTDGAVASIDNMNTFMESYVCQALTNGTTFFWFEAFDEPWKHQFDTAHNHWEPYWGLFDVERNLKDGLKIPDCGGKTVDKPY